MKKAANLRNVYTDSPEQHPNLILGTVKLLFWMVFHPSALRNLLLNVEPSLNSFYVVKDQWPQRENWGLSKLALQNLVIAPAMANLILLFFLVSLGTPIGEALSYAGDGLAVGLAVDLSFTMLAGRATLGLAGGVSIGPAVGLARGWTFNGAVGVVLGLLTFGLALGLTLGLSSGILGRLKSDLILASVMGLVLSIVLGLVFGVASGVAFGVAFGVGLSIKHWLLLALYPCLAIGCRCLQVLDEQAGPNSTHYFLRWHPAFWCEWQRFRWPGLDKHILLILEANQEEGQAAINYLSTSRQRWAVQAVQLEQDLQQSSQI